MHFWTPLLARSSDTQIEVTLLGGATLFDPGLDAGIQMSLLGPATVISPSVGIQGAPNISEYGRRVFAGAAINEYGRRVFTAVDEYGRRWFGSEALSLYPNLLGGARVFDPGIQGQNIESPILLGPASVIPMSQVGLRFNPTTLGPATVFSPGIRFDITLVELLGPAVIFELDHVADEQVGPFTLLGGAVVYDPSGLFMNSIGSMPLLGGAQMFNPTDIAAGAATGGIVKQGAYVVIRKMGSHADTIIKRGEFTV